MSGIAGSGDLLAACVVLIIVILAASMFKRSLR